MEGNKPLVMKLSVNLTAHGTMIFIPAYWSFDNSRDVRWEEVMKLHKARALKKQGESLAESHEERVRMRQNSENLMQRPSVLELHLLVRRSRPA
jgi:hypothetical protein